MSHTLEKAVVVAMVTCTTLSCCFFLASETKSMTRHQGKTISGLGQWGLLDQPKSINMYYLLD